MLDNMLERDSEGRGVGLVWEDLTHVVLLIFPKRVDRPIVFREQLHRSPLANV